MSTPELDVLKPIDPSISHPDDYEIFVLSDAQVVFESNGKPASLLSAYADVPLRVEGRLEAPDRSQTKCLVKKPYKPVDLVVRHVTRFSYGQMTDGELVIWALGEAGWFEIRAARHYKDMYDSMAQAVELLYFITDIYNEPRKRGGGPSAQLVFQEYAEDARFACNDPVVAAQIFNKHHQFLIMCFTNKAQGIGWSNTPIYQHFKRHYPDVFEAAKARKEGRYNQVPKGTRTTKQSPAVPSVNVSTTPQPRTARAKTQIQKTSEAPKKDDNWWEAAAIYEFIRSAINKRALRPGRDHITLDRVANLMTMRYEIDEVETARQVLLVHAENLCYKINHPRSKSASFLANEPIYQELEAGHSLPAADIRRALAIKLRPRRDHAALERAQSDESEVSSDEVVVTPQRRPDGRKKKGRLSVLRPKSSKFSGKGKGVKRGKDQGKAMAIDESSAEDADSSAEAEVEGESDSDSVIEIDTPTQALSPSRVKRKFIDIGDDEEENGRRKRAASESVSPESPPSTEDDEDTEAAEAANEAPLPLRHRANNVLTNGKTSEPKSDHVAPTISTQLPTYEPNGPRNSWICTFDGCSQRIYGASKDLGRQLITEHLEDHAKGRQDVVGIVWREKEKLALPVSNLLKKIREISESQTPLFPQAAAHGPPSSPALQPHLQPQPIRRAL